MEHFLACHIHAFTAMGMPQTLLYDNLKTAILDRRSDGSPVLPARFLDFALYYGFSPRFCAPYRARTKGKVERTVAYVRGNFWVRVAQEIKSAALELGDLNQRAREWVEQVANARVHGTHGEVVAERYRLEEAALGQVYGRPAYDTSYRCSRRVGRDGRFSYGGRLYQLSLSHAFGQVEVAESLDGTLSVQAEDGTRLGVRAVTEAGALVGRQWLGEQPRAGQEGKLLPFLVGAEAVEVRDLGFYEEVACAACAG